MIVRFLLPPLMAAVTVFSSSAQTGRHGSAVLEGYVRQGVAGNLALKQERLEVERSVQMLQQAKALFYPQFTFAPTYSVAFGGRRLAFPVGDMLNPAYAALNQLTGTNQFPTDIRNVNELLAPHNFHDTKISFQYAVYNPEIRYNHLIRYSLLSAEEARLRLVTSELRYAISEAYYRYLQALNIREVYNAARSTLLELVRLNTRLVENNVVTRDAVLSAEYELTVLDRQKVEADKDVSVAGAYFNFLLNRDLEEEIVVDTLLNKFSFVSADQVDLQGLIGRSLTGRAELKQLDYSLLASAQAQ